MYISLLSAGPPTFEHVRCRGHKVAWQYVAVDCMLLTLVYVLRYDPHFKTFLMY